MDILSNLSCCFDASQDIAETGVELVVCDIPVSKQCCVRWETATYVAAVIFSLTDFIADVFGYVSFTGSVQDKEKHTNIHQYLAHIYDSKRVFDS